MYRKELYNNYRTRFDDEKEKITLSGHKDYISYLKKTYAQYLPKDKSSRILELAAGYGFFLFFLREEGYSNCLGIEISRESINIAKRLGIDNIKCADIKFFLRDKDTLYDVIVAIDVLEHFHKDEVFLLLQRIHAALKDNGILLLQVPNGHYPFGGIYLHGDFTHETIFSPVSMRQILRVVGFDNVMVRSCDTYKIKPFYRYLFWKMIRKIVKFYIKFETFQRIDILSPNFIAVGKRKSKQ